MTIRLNRPIAKDNRRLTTKDVNELTIQVALFLLLQTHTVPTELYRIIEDRNLGPACIERAEETGIADLITDAIAQWG